MMLLTFIMMRINDVDDDDIENYDMTWLICMMAIILLFLFFCW